jgi:exodeoxyribonuclease VII small subunit
MAKSKTFGDNIDEVEEILRKLENGEISLEESIDLYKNGMKIIKDCSAKIDKIEKDLKLIQVETDENME